MRAQLPAHAAVEGYLRRIDSHQWYSNFGPLERTLAARLAAHFGAVDGSTCLMANALLGLTVALQDISAGKPGGLCLLPSWTFAGSAHAVLLSGLTPLFVDVDLATGQITPEIAGLVAEEEDIAAVLVVSELGQPVDPAPWESFRDAFGATVVIDGAGAFDTTTASSLATVVSMHATKPVACGEGAFILCNDLDLIERCRRRSNFGFDAQRCAQLNAINAKMSEYHAAVGLAALDEWPGRRAQLLDAAGIYRARIAGSLPASLQKGWGEGWISTTLNLRFLADRNLAGMCDRLIAVGVEARRWWEAGCHAQPAFGEFRRRPLPSTEALGRRTLGLPFSAGMDHLDVERVVDRLRRFL